MDDATDRIWASHKDDVLRYALSQLRDDEAYDVAQRVYLVVRKKGGDTLVAGSEKAWLMGVTVREVRAVRRQRWRRWMYERPAADLYDPWPKTNAGILVRDALKQVSAEHAEVFVLREIQGLSIEEAAEVLKVPDGTVMSRLHHAKKALQRVLEERTKEERHGQEHKL